MANTNGAAAFFTALGRFCLMFFASSAIGAAFGLVSAMISFSQPVESRHDTNFKSFLVGGFDIDDVGCHLVIKVFDFSRLEI